MFPARAFRFPTRAALVVILLLTSALPVSASSVTTVVTASSPLLVTAGLPVAYPVSVTNSGNNTLNHVTITGIADSAFEYVGALPDGVCSDAEPLCDLGQLASGVEVPEIVMYFTVPQTPGLYDFKVRTTVSEGDRDNSDGKGGNQDTFVSNIVATDVRAPNPNFVSGHSLAGVRTFTTGGIDCARLGLPSNCEPGTAPLDKVNQHGTRVNVPINAAVTIADLPPGHPEADCPAEIAATCFGWGSSFSVADGATVPGGIQVTMRWDASELPKGMTARKLRIAHLLGNGDYAPVKVACAFDGGVPTNMPCISVKPFTLRDKDIQATFYLASNRVSRGY